MDVFDELVASRDGSVLSRAMILKEDTFLPDTATQGTLPIGHINGANNVSCGGDSVLLLGQPTKFGIIGMLNALRRGLQTGPRGSLIGGPPTKVGKNNGGGGDGDAAVFWVTLREEPIIYINSRPFVLREAARPFHNLSQGGAMGLLKSETLDELEGRLKEDILHEAEASGGFVLVHVERDRGTLSAVWEPLDQGSVETHSEVFQRMGGRVRHLRAPVPPESSPSPLFFEQLLAVAAQYASEAGGSAASTLVFNDQFGRGRATLAAASSLLIRRRRLSLVGTGAPSYSGMEGRQDPDGLDALRRGEFLPIVALVQALEHGREVKREADTVIDMITSSHNLRTVVLAEKLAAQKVSGDVDRHWRNRAVQLLRTYFMVVAFAGYLDERREGEGFVAWWGRHKELETILEAVGRDPRSALEPPGAATTAALAAASGGAMDEVTAEVLARSGSFLASGCILKRDSRESHGGADGLPGAPAFRATGDLPIYAMASATLEGYRNALAYMGPACKSCVIVSLRDEPVVFVRSEPYVIRELAEPLQNRDTFARATGATLDSIEGRIKDEIAVEAARPGGLLVHAESPGLATGMQGFRLAAVSPAEVQTSTEFFAALKAYARETHGIEVTYARVPVVTRAAPSPESLDDLFAAVKGLAFKEGAAVLFSCGMGRGRSTLGQVVAAVSLDLLTHHHHSGGLATMAYVQTAAMRLKMLAHTPQRPRANPAPPPPSSSATLVNTTPVRSRQGSPGPTSPSLMTLSEPGSASGVSALGAPASSSSSAATAGAALGFGSENSLLRVLTHGAEMRKLLDHYIQIAGRVTNLKQEIIDSYLRGTGLHTAAAAAEAAKAAGEASAGVPSLSPVAGGFELEAAKTYLLRYLSLVAFTSFVDKYAAAPEEARPAMTFASWLTMRPEVAKVLHDLARLPAENLRMVSRLALDPHAHVDDVKRVVLSRHGAVLAMGMVIKSDHFPGAQRPNLRPVIEGAPNFRQVPAGGLRVHGVAVPRTLGIRNVLDHLGQGTPVLWINLREEPVLFVNTRPYVLRDFEAPFANVEHTGITAERVVSMERRLKEEVAEEASASGGKVLLHDESASGGLEGLWEPIGEGSIVTPDEVYDELRSLGYPVQYARVPVTDESTPLVEDFDTVLRLVRDAGPDVAVVFNCQMGRGRTTTGMVIACLVHHALGWAPGFSAAIAEGAARIKAAASAAAPPAAADLLKAGEYRLIRGLVRLCDAVTTKLELDATLDICSDMQNLRTATYDCVAKARQGDKGMDHRARLYLERYAMILTFYTWFDKTGRQDPKATFAAFWSTRPEIGELIKKGITEEVIE